MAWLCLCIFTYFYSYKLEREILIKVLQVFFLLFTNELHSELYCKLGASSMTRVVGCQKYIFVLIIHKYHWGRSQIYKPIRLVLYNQKPITTMHQIPKQEDPLFVHCTSNFMWINLSYNSIQIFEMWYINPSLQFTVF